MPYDEWKANEPDPNADASRADAVADAERAAWIEGRKDASALRFAVTAALEDDLCSSCCLDNAVEIERVARHVTMRLIAEGWRRP